tara:strand:+ start:20286 stop:21053 length:768 start_codon:yes stop_codon:yes gene_type:complete
MNFKPIFKKKIFEDFEILQLREYFKKINIFNKSMKLTNLENTDHLTNFIFSKKLIEFIKLNLDEEFYFINSFAIQKNNRTSKKEKYHKDSGKRHQSDIISKTKNFYGKIGIPLQDNIKGHGGGIDYLKPMMFDDFSDRNSIKNKIRSIYYILQDKLTDTHCYTKVGDVLVFSAMLSHRTSLTEINKLKLVKDKFVIYSQITNLNTIIDVLKTTRGKVDISIDELNKNIIIKKINDIEIKILDESLSTEIGNYIGL